MSKTLVIWFFLLLNILTYSAYGDTRTNDTGDFRTKGQKDPKRNHFSTLSFTRFSLLLFFLWHCHLISCTKIASKLDILITNNLSLLHAVMSDMIEEPSKTGIQRTFSGLNVSQQTRISGLARGIYRVPSNSNPHNTRSRSNSYSIKPSSLFMAALRHLFFALLLVPCFFWIPTTRMFILTYLFPLPWVSKT